MAHQTAWTREQAAAYLRSWFAGVQFGENAADMFAAFSADAASESAYAALVDCLAEYGLDIDLARSFANVERDIQGRSVAVARQRVERWIAKALRDARPQSWWSLIGEDSLLDDLREWADDGMFRDERSVRDRLCQWCQGQIGQIGRPNFRCAI